MDESSVLLLQLDIEVLRVENNSLRNIFLEKTRELKEIIIEKENIIEEQKEKEHEMIVERERLDQELEELKERIEQSENKIRVLNDYIGNIEECTNIVIKHETIEREDIDAENEIENAKRRKSSDQIEQNKRKEEILERKVMRLRKELELSNENQQRYEISIESLKANLREKVEEMNSLKIQIDGKFVSRREMMTQTNSINPDCYECIDAKRTTENALKIVENYTKRLVELNEQIRNANINKAKRMRLDSNVTKQDAAEMNFDLGIDDEKCGKVTSEKLVYTCDICNEKFDRKNQIEVHMTVHVETDKCAFCKRIFANKYSLARHVNHFCPRARVQRKLRKSM